MISYLPTIIWIAFFLLYGIVCWSIGYIMRGEIDYRSQEPTVNKDAEVWLDQNSIKPVVSKRKALRG